MGETIDMTSLNKRKIKDKRGCGNDHWHGSCCNSCKGKNMSGCVAIVNMALEHHFGLSHSRCLSLLYSTITIIMSFFLEDDFYIKSSAMHLPY